MLSIAGAPDARRLVALSIAARLPLAMLSIALLVHTQHLTGSFAAAGVVTGVYALSLGLGGPLLGRLVDRRGQTAVLLAGAAAAAGLLTAIALLPSGAPLGALAALAAGLGLAAPPVGACLRTVLPSLLHDAGTLRSAYALEASAVELTWVAGPPLALALGAWWSTGAALVAGGAVLLCATVAFAADPASRGWRPERTGPRPRGGSLRTPAMRTLVIVLLAVGVAFGVVEVAVTAAAESLGSTTAAAPLLGLWGAGSLVGGLVFARLGGRLQGAGGLASILVLLTAGHLALAAVAESAAALGAVLFVAGAAIAPTYAAVHAMVDRAAPSGTVTEAFAWLATAVAVGAAVGVAISGVVVEHAGPSAAFALAGAAGAAGLLTTTLRARTLSGADGDVAVGATVAVEPGAA